MPFYDEQAGKLQVARELPAEAITAIEMADATSIIEHISGGAFSTEYLYTFPVGKGQDRKQVVGIGVDAAAEIARLVGNIEVMHQVQIEDRGDAYWAAVRAKNLTRNVIWLGTHCQSKTKTLRDGSTVTDEHAFTIAISKATRNAVLRVIPQEIVIQIVERFLREGKSRQVGPPETPTTKPQPLSKATAVPVEAPIATAAAPPKVLPSVQTLGFADLPEQLKLRKELLLALQTVGMTEDEMKGWIAKRDIASTATISKESLLKLIEDAKTLKEVVAAPEDF